jgi:protein-S-isoprenylcysteine O-methyltransferase Ste14
MRPRLTRSGLATAGTNLALAGLYVFFASAQLTSFLRQPRASVLLIVVIETLFAIFFLLRREATAASTSFVAWASTTVGTLMPLLMRPVPVDRDLLAAQLVQLAGSALAVASILCLNRSLGLLPANRGVRSIGTYRIVRHPLYASYLVIHLGYVASNFTVWNVAVMSAALTVQLVRIQDEERLLSNDPEYVAYRERTRWRLVPFVY